MNPHLLSIACCLCMLVACQKSDRLQVALTHAGENRMELEKVLHHYEGDTLKPRAARFLIENMPYHFSAMETMVSPEGKEYYPDITRFNGKEAVKRHCDSLFAVGYRVRKQHVFDIRTLTAGYLIDQIDLAFEAWGKPWAREVSFDDFCRYVLPYRAENEAVCNIRKQLMDTYIPLLDSAGVQSVDDACRVINERLKSELRFSETGHPLKSTIEETLRARTGACDALCNYMIYVMRAVGLPIVRHQTVWTRMDNSHFWTAVKLKDGFFDFDPGENLSDSLQYALASMEILRPAKVYRRVYEADLSLSATEDDGYVTFLKSPLLRDVTAGRLIPAHTLHVPVPGSDYKEGRQLYLCTYNHFRWTPIAVGHADGRGHAVFADVAGRNFLMVAEAESRNGLRMVGVPFYTDGKGGSFLLDTDTGTRTGYTFTRKEDGPLRILYYWDKEANDFVKLDCDSYTDSTQTYTNIPKNALIHYRKQTTKGSQPVGMIHEGEYVSARKW